MSHHPVHYELFSRRNPQASWVLEMASESRDVVTQTAEEVLASRYHLTRAEIEISKAIASGATVEDIAAGRRVSDNTVRTQLKRIFAKTDISRQSQLALLVTGLARPR